MYENCVVSEIPIKHGSLNDETACVFVDKLTASVQKYDVIKRELIESRIGKRFGKTDQICQKHRLALGIEWKTPKTCCHPQICVLKGDRPTTPEQHDKIVKKFGKFSMPIGGMLCQKHRKESLLKCDVPEAIKKSRKAMKEIRLILEINDGHHLLQRPIDHYDNKTLQSVKRDFKGYMHKAREFYIKNMAPFDIKALENMLPVAEQNLVSLAFQECRSKEEKKTVVTVFSGKVANKTLQEVGKVSKRLINNVKRKKLSPEEPPQKKIRRNRLDNEKVEHFLMWLFDSNILAEAAYGSTKILFDDGHRETVPKPVLTMAKTRAIKLYNDFCLRSTFEPLSKSTLFRLFRRFKPSQRKAMAAMDNFLVECMEAFVKLKSLLQDIIIADSYAKEINAKLLRAEQYVRGTFINKCQLESPSESHCIGRAISNMKQKCFTVSCDTPHTEQCVECINVVESINLVRQLIENQPEAHQKQVQLNDLEKAQCKVLDYMSHCLRSKQQRKAKEFCKDQIRENDTKSLWVSDWGQKVLPMRYRESMAQYFGKAGMSIHADCFFTYENDWKISTYVTCIDKCDQSMKDVLCVSDVVISEFVKDHPKIKTLFRKTDRAGCYTAAGAIECVASVCKKYDLHLARVDYNEACDGKDECDRKFSLLKTAMRYYRDEGNNILSANDMMNAIIERCTNQKIKCCVIQIDSKKTTAKNFTKIENISNIHSIEILSGVLRVWNYFGIGVGKLIPLKTCQFVSGAKVIRKFEEVKTILTSTCTGQNSRQSFVCDYCKYVFNDVMKYEEHLVKIICDPCTFQNRPSTSSWDKAIETYKNACNLTNKQHLGALTTDQTVVRSELYQETFEGNWAVKKVKRTRFTKAQKQFLDNCFNKGAKNGKPMTPEEVEKTMKLEASGFKSGEYLEAKQIKSYMSLKARKQKSNGLNTMLYNESECEEVETDFNVNMHDILTNFNFDEDSDES